MPGPAACTAGQARPARLLRSDGFVMALRVPACRSTAHFALHHHRGPLPPLPSTRRSKLSTTAFENGDEPVDELPSSGLSPAHSVPLAALGAVVPKRHARRAVTRNLLKRQIREAAGRHGTRLAPGIWVVRLRVAFDRAGFPSAASAALKAAARHELDKLLGDSGPAVPVP